MKIRASIYIAGELAGVVTWQGKQGELAGETSVAGKLASLVDWLLSLPWPVYSPHGGMIARARGRLDWLAPTLNTWQRLGIAGTDRVAFEGLDAFDWPAVPPLPEGAIP